MVVALADISGLQKVATFTLNNLFQPGDTIHTTYVEDTANSGVLQTLAQLRDACEAVSMECGLFIQISACTLCYHSCS